MYRRVISICVLAGFLAAQWGAMPHAHALTSGVPFDHAATPHVHVVRDGQSLHQHAHGHEHGTGHVHHIEPAVGKSGCEVPACTISGMSDHDANAIYLPAQTSATPASGVDFSKALESPALICFVDADLLGDQAAACHEESLRRLGERAPERTFCLSLRALRI